MRKSKVTWRIMEKELVIIVQERQVCKGLLRTRVELWDLVIILEEGTSEIFSE